MIIRKLAYNLLPYTSQTLGPYGNDTLESCRRCHLSDLFISLSASSICDLLTWYISLEVAGIFLPRIYSLTIITPFDGSGCSFICIFGMHSYHWWGKSHRVCYTDTAELDV